MILFVYGSLMKRASNHFMIQNHSKFLFKGFIKGQLYDLNVGFPAVTQGDSEVFGEVYDVDDHIMEDLDNFEGFIDGTPEDCLFNREIVKVTPVGKKRIDNIDSLKIYSYIMPKENLNRFAYEKLGGRWV